MLSIGRDDFAENHRLAGCVRTPLRGRLIRLRDDPSDNAETPAAPSLNEKIIFNRAISADLAERNA